MAVTIKRRLLYFSVMIIAVFSVQVVLSIVILRIETRHSLDLKEVQGENMSLKSRMIDHLLWANDLLNSIVEEKRFTGETDDHKCKFGKWYYGYIYSESFNVLGPVRKGYIKDMESYHRELHRSALGINEAKDKKEAMDIYKTRTQGSLAALQKLFGDFVDRNILRQGEREAAGNHFRDLLNMSNWISISIIAILVVVISFFTIRGITSSIRHMARGLSATASGDLTVKIKTGYRDELGMLADNMNEFNMKIAEIIRDVKDAATQLASSSNELTATSLSFSQSAQNQAAATEEINATIEEMSAGMDNVAAGAEIQSSSMESFATLMGELSRTIADMGEMILNSMKISEDITVRAHTGGESLERMNESMTKISDSSKQMTGIVKIINEISDQINLLSLNAAIEAARAGEAGRGFAVVADEISKLADQTASSINEIRSLIAVNDDEISRGLSNVDETVQVIGDIIERVSEVSVMMERINSNMRNQMDTNNRVNGETDIVRGRSGEIRTATGEQRLAMSEIVRSIASINELTQGIAMGTEEISANAEEISGMSESLKAKVDFFKV